MAEDRSHTLRPLPHPPTSTPPEQPPRPAQPYPSVLASQPPQRPRLPVPEAASVSRAASSSVLGLDMGVGAVEAPGSGVGSDELTEAYLEAHYAIPPLRGDTHRDRIAYELLSSETVYVRSLHVLLYHWRRHLLQAARNKDVPVSEGKVATLFGNAEHIEAVNLTLWAELRTRFVEWDGSRTMVGEVVQALTPFLKMYTAYLAHYDAAIASLGALLRPGTRFHALHERLAQSPLSQRLPLAGFLILPVQRVPRYVLLLADLLKHTPPEHADHAPLTHALAQMRAVAEGINAALAEAESAEKMLAVQARFASDVTIVAASRRYVLEGVLVKQCRKERKHRAFFLFSDTLFYAIPPPGGLGTLTLSKALQLERIAVADLPDDPVRAVENAFQIRAPGKSFNVFCSSAAEKERWVSALQTAIAAAQAHALERGVNVTVVAVRHSCPSHLQATAWDADDTASACVLCAERFNLVRRRHHCRQCGKVVCGDCSSHRLLVPAVDMKSVTRVCDNCYRSRTNAQ